MNKLNLKETFDFITTILKCRSDAYDKIDDSTYSQDHEEVLEAYHFYDDGELKIHTCTLILLADKIEYVECKGQTDSYVVLSTETE